MIPIHALQQYLIQHNLDACIIPHSDMFQGEYLVPQDEVLQWLTGFSGSAGLCIVTRDQAILFVDGRYTLQAAQQVDTHLIVLKDLGHEIAYLKNLMLNTEVSYQIAFDPWVITPAQLKRFQDASPPCVTYVPREHFMHALWMDRPEHPMSPLVYHPLKYTGCCSVDKCAQVAQALIQERVDGYVLGPESWSWLLNVRGGDLPYTPLSQGFAWVEPAHSASASPLEIHVFVYQEDQTTLSASLTSLAQSNAPDDQREAHILSSITFHPLKDLSSFLGTKRPYTLGYDPHHTPLAIVQVFDVSKPLSDPCILPRALKNSVEVEGARRAHIKDARAFRQCHAWLKKRMSDSVPTTELDVVDALLQARWAQENFHSPSFDTIAGYESNGAIVHYKPSPLTNKVLTPSSLLLVDSGGQYKEGTTDVTRTLCLGTPTSDMILYYTLVLKAHIQLARAVFPKGTPGTHLDSLARAPLWAYGLDYAHGTGHGVGSFLSVHEGPQRISSFNGRTEGLQEGMIVSIEPGLYFEGRYGIRLENLVVVQRATPQSHPFQNDVLKDKEWLYFEALTLIPFEEHLIDYNLLDTFETQWLHEYHAKALAIAQST